MARAIWKGTLGFGLVNISVELLSAEKTDELDLDLLDRRDNARIGYQKINKTTGAPVAAEDIVRGFAVSESQYVVLSDADLKNANPKATQSIDIVGFTADADIPRAFFAKPYYVSPLKGSERAYALLREVLRKSEQLALARVVIHTRQHMAAVYPHESALVVQLLRYSADLKSPDDAGVRTVPALTGSGASKEVTMAEQLVASMLMEWEPESYVDTYRDDLMTLIRQRSKKGSGKASPSPRENGPGQTKVLDLVAALQRSLSAGTRPSARKNSPPRRKAPPSTATRDMPRGKKVAKKSAAKKSRSRVA